MADMTPIGTMANPVQQGLGNLSSILGIQGQQIGLQQAQQNLQTGQYTQATAQAESQQADQRNKELQAAQALAKNGVTSGAYTNPDGSFNRQKMSEDIAKVAPTYGQGVSNQLLSGANEVIANKRAVQSLNQDQQTQLAGMLNGLATKKDLSNSDILDTANMAAEMNPSPEFRRMLMSTLMHFPPNASSDQLAQGVRTMASQLSGQGQQAPSTVDTGAAIQPGATNRYTGGFTPAGGAIAKQTPPGIIAGPTGEMVSVPGGGAGLPSITDAGKNLNTQQQTTFASQAKGVAERVEQAKGQANNTVQAQDALGRAKAILESPNAPSTGPGYENVKHLKNMMSSLGIDTQGADDMNTLTKNLARYEAQRATASGLGSTDAARELAHSGSPNTQLDNKALLGIVRQSLATEKALASYAKVQSKTSDPQALVKNESDFRGIPNVIQAHEYGMMRNSKEADDYLSQHGLSKAEMAKARAAIKEFDSR